MKLVVAEYVSLDGVMEEPGWTGPYFNEEMAEFQRSLLFSSDALLLGRVTYEGFAAAWPSMTDEAGFADKMNSMPKFVVSTTLEEPLEWNNSSLIEGDLAEGVSRLKQRPGGDLLVYGSAALVNALMRHDLVDEYRLMVHPLVLGGGKRLFGEGGDTKAMRLVRAQTTETGVAVLDYAPQAEDSAG
ncbi:dihydrofolate reductase [Rubrobacter marinus]|uniref:Dihydrofolate reductase n=1 Tax=Rubrobacter marinus TaxID=2653852 RepID=A0A6G8PZ25_9ACTN|nr:dihydrofolate reductase family protein [Rubrobacter marinus]QIN79387.1 dihydrofolate reductase [Rubrobacter marinus]